MFPTTNKNKIKVANDRYLVPIDPRGTERKMLNGCNRILYIVKALRLPGGQHSKSVISFYPTLTIWGLSDISEYLLYKNRIIMIRGAQKISSK